MQPKEQSQSYKVDAVSRACDILESFSDEGETLRLTDIAERTGLHKTTVLRFLTTLETRGLVIRSFDRRYRLGIRLPRRRRFRLGYATQSTEFSFSREVTDSIIKTANREDVELVLLDNRYGARTALRNADMFVREGVDLVIEFQTDEQIASLISSRFTERQIPMIAIEIPHPGAVYYGANNYEAGLVGGHFLARWVKSKWQGQVDDVVLLELRKAGPLPQARLTGMLTGLRDLLPHIGSERVTVLDGNGQFGVSLEVMRKFLKKRASRKTVVCAVNDPSAIGALRAFEESGRQQDCAVIGQNGSVEARTEMRREGSRLIASVGYFPERYGEGLLPLALDMLNRRRVEPAVFVKHKLITAENVNHLYPNDPLLHPFHGASLL